MNVTKDIIETLKVIKQNKENRYDLSSYHGFSPCYKFSNENMSGYYNKDISKALTVCGSGDQVLCAILKGAKTIDCFDSNPLTYYTMMLKLYLIKYTDCDTFKEFYNLKTSNRTQKEIFETIKNKIEDESIKQFWIEIFELTHNIDLLFSKDVEQNETIHLFIPYLSKNNFDTLKQNLNDCKIKFINLDIFQIANHFKEKYDFINLSNIYLYVKDEDMLKFCKLINELINNNLQKEGTIIVNYIWNKSSSSESVSELKKMIDAFYNIELKEKDIEANSSILYKKK